MHIIDHPRPAGLHGESQENELVMMEVDDRRAQAPERPPRPPRPGGHAGKPPARRRTAVDDTCFPLASFRSLPVLHDQHDRQAEALRERSHFLHADPGIPAVVDRGYVDDERIESHCGAWAFGMVLVKGLVLALAAGRAGEGERRGSVWSCTAAFACSTQPKATSGQKTGLETRIRSRQIALTTKDKSQATE